MSSSVERADVLGLLVGHADEAHADLVLGGGVLEGAHHRREAALHVIGAAADEAVALGPRVELALAPGDDVEVPVEDDHGAVGRPDLGQDHRQAVVVAVGDRHLARLQPALDEPGRGAELIDLEVS